MVTKYYNIAVYDLNRYLWSVLKTEHVLDEDDYYVHGFQAPVVPIAPISEQPEFANQLGSNAYFVYDILSGNNYSEEWWTCRDEILYTIYCPDVDKINEIINLMVAKFRRMDESAANINNWLAVNGTSKFQFQWSEVQNIDVSGHAEQEGSRAYGQIILAYEYMRDIDAGEYT